jgi:hypothetical protein
MVDPTRRPNCIHKGTFWSQFAGGGTPCSLLTLAAVGMVLRNTRHCSFFTDAIKLLSTKRIRIREFSITSIKVNNFILCHSSTEQIKQLNLEQGGTMWFLLLYDIL